MTESTLPGQVLHHRMENGASVSSWLGTAAVAARLAAGHIEAIRQDRVVSVEDTLRLAETELQQAIDEVFAVQRAVADRNAELRRLFEADTRATQRLVADMEADGLL